MAEGGVPELDVQKAEMKQLNNKSLAKGDVWYLIDAKWYKQWKKYVGFESWDHSCPIGDEQAHPGPVDNAGLWKDEIEELQILRADMHDELDYVLLPEESWKKLTAWYGIVARQRPIARKVVEMGVFVKHYKVEVYLVDLQLCLYSNAENIIRKEFSKCDTLDTVEKAIRKLFDVCDEKETHLWQKLGDHYELLEKKFETVADASLTNGQLLLLEQKNDDGTWPRGTSSQVMSRASTSRDYQTMHSGGRYRGGADGVMVIPGLCGLANLGNTCFMNSAIQCMSNVPMLTQYFLSNDYVREINPDNPLGMHGEIATSYAALVKQIWSGNMNCVQPRDFKIYVGRFAPQFSGYTQQDSQEFMAFMLDGLHEDLNRIKKKPYLEVKDPDGRSDKDVADEAWSNYRKRNDSAIIDIFHGLLKSTLVCPECAKISVTFDPFCFLSVPLTTQKKERSLEIFFIHFDAAQKPIQYKVMVSKQGTISDLCLALQRLTNIPSNMMIVADVYLHRIHKVFNMQEPLNNILDKDDIFVYEWPINTHAMPQGTHIMPVYLRAEKQQDHTVGSSSPPLFGHPFFVAATSKCTYQGLYELLLKRMQRYVKLPDKDDAWWSDTENSGHANGDTNQSVINGEMDIMNTEDDPDENETDNQTGMARSYAAATKHAVSKQRLFHISSVNSYGSHDIANQKFQDDGSYLPLSKKLYLACDWNPIAKKKFYDSDAAEELEKHESLNCRPPQTRSKSVIQLNECIELFMKEEKLGPDDPWYCPSCKKHQQATKKLDLWSLPQILIIHLKRFQYNKYWRDKLDAMVDFPVRGLNMKKFIINKDHGPAVYDLIAVSNHFGGLGGGHYTAHALTRHTTNTSDGWYYFDDSAVRQSSEDQTVCKSAYALFYMRRDAAGWGKGAALQHLKNGLNHNREDDNMDTS